MITLKEFYQMLEGFDWYYQMSDDFGVYKKGYQKEIQLKNIARQSPELETLYQGFNKHMWSGKPWGTEKQPKPEEPK